MPTSFPASTLYSLHCMALFLMTTRAHAAVLTQCIEAYQGVACVDSMSCFPEGHGVCGFLERLKRANRSWSDSDPFSSNDRSVLTLSPVEASHC
ncbi:hypothetical protein PDJAM_G00025860 [Pangasius djambal]|uniref:Uncharacterized protein n=1 Tax=Pangasius djambal TaxID=1691987 RepID=A0ACC5YRB8_9TELE|nr:hypothetical protein [Pangasius djambal]